LTRIVFSSYIKVDWGVRLEWLVWDELRAIFEVSL